MMRVIAQILIRSIRSCERERVDRCCFRSLTLVATLLLSLPGMAAEANSTPGLTPIGLTCEHVVDPMAVDVAQPRLGWSFGAASIRGQRQSAYQVLVASSAERLQADRGDLWDSEKVPGNQNIEVRYGGKPLAAARSYFWKVRVWDQADKPGAFSSTAVFETGLLTEQGWADSAWIAWRPEGEWRKAYDACKRKEIAPGVDDNAGWAYPTRFQDPPVGNKIAAFNVFKMLRFHETPYDPAPLFRREFTADKPLRRARVYISGLGYYELSLNGRRVGDRVLDPGWTDPRARCLYAAYDVTAQLQPGRNALGVMLGRGFQCPIIIYNKFWTATEQPKLRMQLHLEYADGTTSRVVTGPGWKVTGGPVVFDDPYRGEVVDGRRELPGWSTVGFDDSRWTAAVKAPAPAGKMVGQVMQPIRAVQELRAISVTNPAPGVHVYDFGRNIAGWTMLTTQGPAGTEILVRHSEMNLLSKPLPGPGSFGSSYQQFGFILRGEGVETFAPKFCYTGFRYAVVSGAPTPLNQDSVRALHVYTDMAETGEFECSNALLNDIHRAARLTKINNMHGLPTDGPTREKHAWLGDARTTLEMTLFNYDATALHEKWMQDIEDAEVLNGKIGALAAFIPNAPGVVHFEPVWIEACVAVPLNLYIYRGDRGVLETHYDMMKRVVDGMASGKVSDDEPYIVYGKYGDWLAPKTGQPGPLPKLRPQPNPGNPAAVSKEGVNIYATAYYYSCAEKLAKIAGILGKEVDADRYAALARNIHGAFNRAFYDPEMKCYRGENRAITEYRQSANAVPLYLGLVPEEKAPAILEGILKDVADRNDHLNTGFIGAEAMMEVLPERGAAETAYRIAIQTDFPSWGEAIKNGASTVPEAWGDTRGGSQNHPAFGAVADYYYRWLAGIQPDAANPGFRHFFLRPTFVAGLSYVRARHQSPSGAIESHWRRADNRSLTWDIVVPPNTTATIYLPEVDVSKVTESGKPAAKAMGVKFQRIDGTNAAFVLESGHYRFATLAASR